MRAQLTQIEKYQQAANTFYGKYGYLPGDIKDPDASNFGFAARGQFAGEGDGDGVVEGIAANSPGQNLGYVITTGETGMYWVDISKVNLIDATFIKASPTNTPGSLSGSALAKYFPPAKVGNGNYIYVYSRGPTPDTSHYNFFGLSAISSVVGIPNSAPGLTVSQAAAIDKKMDDGMPQSGKVTATYINLASGSNAPIWAAGGGAIGAYTAVTGGMDVTTAATPSSATTCYDNSGVVGPQRYSVLVSNGSYVNCALSFKIQ